MDILVNHELTLSRSKIPVEIKLWVHSRLGRNDVRSSVLGLDNQTLPFVVGVE